LELARATLRWRIDRGDSPDHAVRQLERTLENKGVGALHKSTADRRQTIAAMSELSLELLPWEDRQRLTELAIFAEDIAIPLEAVGALWRLHRRDTQETAKKLEESRLQRERTQPVPSCCYASRNDCRN